MFTSSSETWEHAHVSILSWNCGIELWNGISELTNGRLGLTNNKSGLSNGMSGPSNGGGLRCVSRDEVSNSVKVSNRGSAVTLVVKYAAGMIVNNPFVHLYSHLSCVPAAVQESQQGRCASHFCEDRY